MPVKEVQNPKLSLVIAQFVWHPIEACLWGLTRRRINRFKYGRFSIFHQGFSSEMSFTANYAHGRVQNQRHQLGKTTAAAPTETAFMTMKHMGSTAYLDTSRGK